MLKKALMYLTIFGCLIWTINDLSASYHLQLNNTPPKTATVITKQAQSVPKKLTPPVNSTDPTSGYKWPKPTVPCIINTTNPKLVLAYKDAINAWNQTGAFHFQLTKDKQAPITLGEQDLSSTKSDNGIETSQELGVTDVSYYPEQHLLAKANVKLDNDPMLLNNNRQYIAWVAEHELGHAIGLAHTAQNADSVMVPANPTHGLTNNDIMTVKQLYDE